MGANASRMENINGRQITLYLNDIYIFFYDDAFIALWKIDVMRVIFSQTHNRSTSLRIKS